ncbi:MAG: hypothetical protein UR25_C0003G0094 [Candidatus Nomurabacteria bacterium GW2011_GWE1_32_28]|uniref:Uncharacterized protein n=1 Tax=Candidatus Nomurabacteria bacterium GW2011_GWF1_31_48 TaxID=1618767 RepID=A0A0F9YV29_9BACT|nr:MAG: hypothetical protein UR10_C0003G0094 [Candidatus Nomurabacteria bacterium GW2011_GWF2_30_133]KKP28734.1 MAG: hypothetical protein UR18_C0002G0146 [Candidatus Nomurabacteria bacterium GW2011_GWE2_31_40]KKP30311.1 MAG: hypothetical protein UR19_C0003G0147 [Candidatus Nomurabacteria bacterium GW2011_GWF1_31_48]KKP34838.1 MAG: hypothetical protein UR25_C0003G0094 [Candidatus Nomurabacteria bacterium GW2011_GWE1_32_28]HAS80704.1 hypothetical protein [Candidatus Nomurabacteria bacterium]
METYWTKDYLREIKNVKSFEETADIAISVIKTIPKPVFGLTAPFTTGGHGLANNIKIIEKSIYKLEEFGFNIFNFIPLSIGLTPLIEDWNKNNNDYCMSVIDVTYRQIFESKLLEIIFSIPRNKPSIGAGRESEILLELNIPVLNFPMGWYQEILDELKILR